MFFYTQNDGIVRDFQFVRVVRRKCFVCFVIRVEIPDNFFRRRVNDRSDGAGRNDNPFFT